MCLITGQFHGLIWTKHGDFRRPSGSNQLINDVLPINLQLVCTSVYIAFSPIPRFQVNDTQVTMLSRSGILKSDIRHLIDSETGVDCDRGHVDKQHNYPPHTPSIYPRSLYTFILAHS